MADNNYTRYHRLSAEAYVHKHVGFYGIRIEQPKEYDLEICKALLVSTANDIRLLKEILTHYLLPITIHGVTSIKVAMDFSSTEGVDIIMVNSGLLIKEGFEDLLQVGNIPIVVLSEADGISRYFNCSARNIHFITRPFEIEKMPGMFMQTYKCWQEYLLHSRKSRG